MMSTKLAEKKPEIFIKKAVRVSVRMKLENGLNCALCYIFWILHCTNIIVLNYFQLPITSSTNGRVMFQLFYLL